MMRRNSVVILLSLSILFVFSQARSLSGSAVECELCFYKSFGDKKNAHCTYPLSGDVIEGSAPFDNGDSAQIPLPSFTYIVSKYCACEVQIYSEKDLTGRSTIIPLANVLKDDSDLPFRAKSFTANCY